MTERGEGLYDFPLAGDPTEVRAAIISGSEKQLVMRLSSRHL